MNALFNKLEKEIEKSIKLFTDARPELLEDKIRFQRAAKQLRTILHDTRKLVFDFEDAERIN
jgi:hypothetical protein